MKVKSDTHDVGVIIGRFQVPELHTEHKKLIQAVCDRHNKVILFLGLSPLLVTSENPLDFEARKQMILDSFPHITVAYIADVNDDGIWSKRLDEQIGHLTTPGQSVVLYGGTDSFIKHYSGKYDTLELEPDTYVQTRGTHIRKQIGKSSTKASADFRAGVVWASQSKYPTVYTTVDIAIFNEDYTKLLMGKKENETKWRFIGGFADPASASFEADARREVQEEAGIEITDPVYLGSFNIDDWRYRSEVDQIRTLLFGAKIMYGTPRPGDDIAEVGWVGIIDPDTFDNPDHLFVMPGHLELYNAAFNYAWDKKHNPDKDKETL